MKREFFITLAFLIFFFSFSFSSAVASTCCEKNLDGAWCVNELDAAQCDTNFELKALTNCDLTTFCGTGTCVDTNDGSCTDGSKKAECLNTGGNWYPQGDPAIPAACNKGCCFIGESSSWVTQAACNQLATAHGIETSFLSNVANEAQCLSLSGGSEKGACVWDDAGERKCEITTKNSCVSNGRDFNLGYLCTAEHLNTDCAKTSNTRCEGDKVYFLDDCGNLANVYDGKMFSDSTSAWTQEMTDYWTKIQDPFCNPETDPNCGDCNRLPPVGSICTEYSSSNGATPVEPKFGNYVCGDLACYYDTDGDGSSERYEQGERWCAETAGTLPHIQVEDAENIWNIADKSREKLEDPNNLDKFNIPGSKYTLLTCWNGEVIPEDCMDYRNQYCAEATIEEEDGDEFRTAYCIMNNWRECFNITNEEDCLDEKANTCKWMPGYRFDQKNTNDNSEKHTNNNDEQGSCVPLIAPGFNYWDPEFEQTEQVAGASMYCSLGNYVGTVALEIGWAKELFNGKNSDQLSDNFESVYWDEDELQEAYKYCYDNCYMIPGYGEGYSYSDLLDIHRGNKEIGDGLSTREGYYCWDEDDQNLSTGYEGGTVGCHGKDEKRQYPVFFKNERWLEFIMERTKTLGDCGYKPNLLGEYNSDESQTVSAIFQRIKGKDSEVKEETEEEVIFYADENINDYLNKHPSTGSSPSSTTLIGECEDAGGRCMYDSECLTGTVAGAQCTDNFVCCLD